MRRRVPKVTPEQAAEKAMELFSELVMEMNDDDYVRAAEQRRNRERADEG